MWKDHMLENVNLGQNDKKKFDFNLPRYILTFFIYILTFKPS